MDATHGVIVYAVEHGDYSERCTEVLFTTEVLAREYIAARIAAARTWDDDPDYGYDDRWVVVTYQLWSALPLVPKDLSPYDDIPGLYS